MHPPLVRAAGFGSERCWGQTSVLPLAAVTALADILSDVAPQCSRERWGRHSHPGKGLSLGQVEGKSGLVLKYIIVHGNVRLFRTT